MKPTKKNSTDDEHWWIPPRKESEKDIFVGKECFVRYSETAMLMGNRHWLIHQQGRILLRKVVDSTDLVAHVLEKPLYQHNDNLRGRDERTSKNYDEAKNPKPEVEVLLALLGDSESDRSEALARFMAHRKDDAKKILGRMDVVIRMYEEQSRNLSPWPLDMGNDDDEGYSAAFDFEPDLFQYFVGQWMVTLLEEGRIDEFGSWESDARRAFENHKKIRDPSDSGERRRVFAAIKNAALACGGLPNQKMIRDSLAEDGGRLMPPETVRSILGTLGFSWIPGEPDWKKSWLPVRPKGWK